MSEICVYLFMILLVVVVVALRVYLSKNDPYYPKEYEEWRDESDCRYPKYPKD